MTKTANQPLSNIQLELLQLFSRDLEEDDIVEIRQLIINYLAEKLEKQTNKVWEEKNWTDEDMDRLLNTHMRTPYANNR